MLRFWIDGELTIIHAMIAGIAVLIVDRWWVDALLGLYILYSIAYAAARLSVVINQNRDYLKLPPDDPDIVRPPSEKPWNS